jgi:drug/metabolite transporter superfamily protein YnfA
MSNPEFKRNLWLSFSTHRLIAMPALLALTFIAAALAEQQDMVADRLYSASNTLFIFIVWLWGARNANATIVDELRDKTWDQQRMSALDPWTMTWGKLFGSTSFNWYGGLMCLLVVAASGISSNQPDVLPSLLTLCAIGVLLHAALIALNLHTSQIEVRLIQRGGMGWLAIILVFMLISLFFTGSARHVSWWGTEVDHALFWLNSAMLFAACATFAAWRVVCNALQVRTLPWAWPAFACILAFYLAGFMHDSNRMQALLLTGLFVSGAMTYASLFSEPNTLLKWRKLELLLEKHDRRGWLEHLPLWPTTLALAFLFALLLPLASNDGQPGFARTDFMQPQHALTVALMLLRDACILLFFAFSPNSKRAAGATMLYLSVLNMLLPFLAGIAGLGSLRYFFLPFDAGYSAWSGTFVMSVHAAIAIALVNWRLRSSKEPQ